MNTSGCAVGEEEMKLYRLKAEQLGLPELNFCFLQNLKETVEDSTPEVFFIHFHHIYYPFSLTLIIAIFAFF